MRRYLKRLDHSQEVWATQLTPENVQDLAQRTHGHVVNEFDMVTNEKLPAINLRTYAGMKRLSQTGWLIQYVKDKPSIFEVVSPNQFNIEYEPAEDDEQPEGASDTTSGGVHGEGEESNRPSFGERYRGGRRRI